MREEKDVAKVRNHVRKKAQKKDSRLWPRVLVNDLQFSVCWKRCASCCCSIATARCRCRPALPGRIPCVPSWLERKLHPDPQLALSGKNCRRLSVLGSIPSAESDRQMPRQLAGTERMLWRQPAL